MYSELWASLVAQKVESTYNAGDPGSIPGSGRSPGEENGNPLQYSCLENSMERSLEGYTHGVAMSWTRLSDFTFFLSPLSETYLSSHSITKGKTPVLQAPLSMGILQARILEWVAMPSS